MTAEKDPSTELRRRAKRLSRIQYPRLVDTPKEGWVREFIELYDAQAWRHFTPPISQDAYLYRFQISRRQVARMRLYLVVFDAAVAAGVNKRILSRVGVRTLETLSALRHAPDALVFKLTGKHLPSEK